MKTPLHLTQHKRFVPQSELTEKIQELKLKRSAVILAHNYQRPEIQDIADFTGDSLELSLKASETDADVIVFCGVHFMAETAAIICPDKMVLLPDEHAGCPMANMITARELREEKKLHPGAAVVTYVNSSAAVKAESDYCCTSSSAVRVVNAVPQDREVIFIPDQSLGQWTQSQTGRKLILWHGYCPTHHRILPENVTLKKTLYPDAKVVVHPECITAVVNMADKVASTAGIIRYCRETPARRFLIGTEIGILHRLKKENPLKEFYAITDMADCPNMKLNTLEKVLWALEDLQPAITVQPDIARRALLAIRRMLEIK